MSEDTTNERKRSLLRTMLRIREFEMAVSEHIQLDNIPGFAHLYVGQEAIASGVCAALEPHDSVTSTHRGHGHCIAKGADLKRLMAELWGRATGYCGGRGGSMHVYVKDLNFLGTSGIVGGGLPLSLGPAIHAKLTRSGAVSVCFFGDGAANNGVFHESINLAGVQNLPVVFVCENNLYATVTAVHEATRVKDFATRAAGYGIPGEVVDGNDVLEVLAKAEEAVGRARKGEGPTLLECKTYRTFGHYVGDPGTGYRPQDEIDLWRKKDPVARFKKHLTENRIMSQDDIETVATEARDEVAQAVNFARDSAYPDPAQAVTCVWAGR